MISFIELNIKKQVATLQKIPETTYQNQKKYKNNMASTIWKKILKAI